MKQVLPSILAGFLLSVLLAGCSRAPELQDVSAADSPPAVAAALAGEPAPLVPSLADRMAQMKIHQAQLDSLGFPPSYRHIAFLATVVEIRAWRPGDVVVGDVVSPDGPPREVLVAVLAISDVGSPLDPRLQASAAIATPISRNGEEHWRHLQNQEHPIVFEFRGTRKHEEVLKSGC